MAATEVKNIDLEVLLAKSGSALTNYMVIKGEKYPTDEWVTVVEYCERFGIANTQTVTNWIKRGVVRKDDIVIEEYNNIRLIKAVPYNLAPLCIFRKEELTF